MHDSRSWQLHFNRTLELMERRLLSHPDEGFYSRINSRYSPRKRWLGFDLVDVNRIIPLLFAAVWTVTLLAALGIPWVTSRLGDTFEAMRQMPSNNSMQRAALRAAADAGSSTAE